MSGIENETEPTTPKTRHPVARFIAKVRAFGNREVELRIKWLAGAAAIFFLSVVITQTQFNRINASERDRQLAQFESATYINALATWNQARVTYASCLENVVRSDGNRAWKTWLLSEIEIMFPFSPEAATIVAEGREKLDEYLPQRSVEDCVDPGPPPDLPGG